MKYNEHTKKCATSYGMSEQEWNAQNKPEVEGVIKRQLENALEAFIDTENCERITDYKHARERRVIHAADDDEYTVIKWTCSTLANPKET